MKDGIIIKFLYDTILGRIILKLIINPGVSKVSARFLSSPFSRWMIPVFIRQNHIDMKYYKIPKGGYLSFNDFFTRKKKEKYISFKRGGMISPCDGLLTVSEINEDAIFNIKHTRYSIKELLNSEEMAREYQGGTVFIFSLTPAHYHRYIWAVTGVIFDKKSIGGVLHSVRPICHEKTKVYIQNTREYSVINNPSFGNVIQMEIGALLVGKISNHGCEKGQIIYAGDEKGFFEYGGSSILIITKLKTELSEEIRHRALVGTELPVFVGEPLTEWR